MTDHEIRRANRCTAYNCFAKLDKERGGNLLGMMRTLALEYGIEGALKRCDFAAYKIPPEAIEINRLALEYILFEAEQAAGGERE